MWVYPEETSTGWDTIATIINNETKIILRVRIFLFIISAIWVFILYIFITNRV